MKVYRTGQVAKLCGVAPRQVRKWFDSGRLRGYRIPGTQDLCVPRGNLIRFLKAEGMDVPCALNTVIILSIGDTDVGCYVAAIRSAGYDTAVLRYPNVEAEDGVRPLAILVDFERFGGVAATVCRDIRLQYSEAKLVALVLSSTTAGPAKNLVDAVWSSKMGMETLGAIVESLLSA